MSMSEFESGSATVGGGGRGDAIILTLYVLVVLYVSRCRLRVESGATQFSCLYTVKKQKFISLNSMISLSSPHHSILSQFPHSPPPHPPRPLTEL